MKIVPVGPAGYIFSDDLGINTRCTHSPSGRIKIITRGAFY